MTSAAPQSIMIVGGGSAGWMSALYLNQLYNCQHKRVSITVIESKTLGAIGVGEATLSSIRFLFAAMGIDEQELLRETNATLKTGTLFKQWMKSENGQVHQYFHPFEHLQVGPGLDLASRWLMSERRRSERFDQGVSLASYLMASNHSPKQEASHDYEGVVPYGYQLDANLLGRYLRKKAIAAGVCHIEAKISKVNVEQGNISNVETKLGTYSADIFIDCSGVNGLLIQALNANNWCSFEPALPCNKAVTMQIAYPEHVTPKSYTIATALEHGWAWQIDLINRRGTGYVYDGNCITEQQAEQRLREYNGVNAQVLKTVHLTMQVGCRSQFWLGNCIAIGLAGGYIEPLESTGLHLINIGVRLLATHLSSKQVDQLVKDNYNRLMMGAYQELKQFTVMHYCLSNRDDTKFWLNAQQSVVYCPQLQQHLAVWRHKVCECFDLAGGHNTSFTDENYRFVLYGMQHYPTLCAFDDIQHSRRIFDKLATRATDLLNHTSPHKDYLQKLHAMPLADIAALWRTQSI